jgi:hypothetical protein
MIRFTVGWRDEALHELADVWLASSERDAISTAAHYIDNLLSTNPRSAGKELSEGLCRLDVAPSRVYFVVNQDDCKVEIIKVRTVP